MKTNEEIKSYEPENFEENYKAYLVGLLSTDYECVMNDRLPKKKKIGLMIYLRDVAWFVIIYT